MFNPATRHEAAKQLEASFRNSAEQGEYDHVDTRIGGRASEEVAERPSGQSFTPGLSGNYVGRRVEIVRVRDQRPSSYFKVGQFGYVVGQTQKGGMAFIDLDRNSEDGEVALLIAKTRDMRGGAVWFSLEGVRFTGKVRETTTEERRHSMSYGELPPFEKFEEDIRRPDPDHEGHPYWPEYTRFPIELVSDREIELAERYGLPEFEAERRRTGRNSRVRGFNADEREMYGFLEYLIEQMNDGDDEAGDLASSIMTTLGYEWI